MPGINRYRRNFYIHFVSANKVGAKRERERGRMEETRYGCSRQSITPYLGGYFSQSFHVITFRSFACYFHGIFIYLYQFD